MEYLPQNIIQKMKKSSVFRQMRSNYSLYVMLLLPLIYFITFRYVPMTNIVVAFKDYSIFKGVWESPWAHTSGSLDIFKYFKQAFSSVEFLRVLRNTVLLNFLDLAIGFFFPVMLAIMLNEITFRKFKRFTQTVLYMPFFLSWIIIYGIALQILAPETGLVNIFLRNMGMGTIRFLDNRIMWVVTYVALGIWQSAGYNTIVYLAAITGINPELYEASEVDGAGRLRKILHITLPGIKPTIVVMLILNMGRLLQIGFDRPYAMQNPLVRSVADVISTYVFRVGIQAQQLSLTTAVGFFQSVVCLIFLIGANFITEKIGEQGIW